MKSALMIPVVLALSWCCVGCVGGSDRRDAIDADVPPATLRLAPTQYEIGFNAVRDHLRRMGFTLERIDAAEGVITTRPRASAGLLIPWDLTQSDGVQERREALTPVERTVRVSFEPLAGGRPIDQPEAAMEVRVRVGLARVRRPGFRASPVSIRLSGYAIDPKRYERGVGGRQAIPHGRDPALEERIASAIRARISRQNP